jgi:hypothetical protein
MTEATPINLIALREQEIADYQRNVTMYTAILADLPTEWPSHLEKYRTVENRHDAIAEVEDLTDVELLSSLWYASDCHKSIRTETIEMTKSKAILKALEAQA